MLFNADSQVTVGISKRNETVAKSPFWSSEPLPSRRRDPTDVEKSSRRTSPAAVTTPRARSSRSIPRTISLASLDC